MPHADAYSRNGIRHESLPLYLQLLSKHGYLTSSPLPATKHDEDATLAVINRTNVLKDLLATPTPQSHPRTASFPPRGHPCTLIRLALPSVGPSDVDCVICSLATSDDTRIGFSCGTRLHLASLTCITTGTVCVLFSQSSSRLHSCVWVGRGSLGVHLHSRARHWHRNSAGTTYVVQGLVSQSFRPTSARCSPRSCSVALLCRRVRFVSLAISLSAVTCRTCTSATCDSCSRRCITNQVPRGQRAPLDHFRLLLIDRSAESVESSPDCSRRELVCLPRTLLTHFETHLEALFVNTYCGTHLDLHVEADTSFHHSRRQLSVLTRLYLPVEAIMPCWHHHRHLAPLTHLELRVEDHCRSSFLR